AFQVFLHPGRRRRLPLHVTGYPPRTIRTQAVTQEYSNSCWKRGTLSQLLGMAPDLLLRLWIGEQLSSGRIDPQGSDATEDALSGQRKQDGNGPIDALADGQLGRIGTELRAEFLHDILRDPLARGKRRDVERLRHPNVDVQSALRG